MKKSTLSVYRKKAGDLAAIYGAQEIALTEGRAKDIRGYLVKNGQGLQLMILRDRGMDIPFLEFKGVNMAALTKSGVSSPFSYTYTKDLTDSFLRQFFAGFLTTCGMTYAGAPSEDDSRQMPLHGMLSNSIAEQVGISERIENDEIVLVMKGQIREARLFGENMVLHREIHVYTESNRIKVKDTVENRGFRKEPVMMIYHVNLGFPLLDTGAKLYFSTEKVSPLTSVSAENIHKYNIIEEPSDNRSEEVFIHTDEDSDNEEYAVLHNEVLQMAVKVVYQPCQLPILAQWKSMQSGDYALGLEPTTSGTTGFVNADQKGLVKYLEGQETTTFEVEFHFSDNKDEITRWIRRTKEYKKEAAVTL